MNDNEIFTEYDLEVQKARQEANKLAREANENLQYFTERGVQKPHLVTMYIGTYAGKDMSKIKFNEAAGQFEPLTPDAVLDPATMTFVNPAHVAARDKENVKRLQEISGK